MPVLSIDAEEARRAAAGDAVKRDYVRRMFSDIAPRYDLLNHLLSFNIDRRWRGRAIAKLDVGRAPRGVYLDLCAGTLEVGAELARTAGFQGFVLGADFAEPMLRRGAGKAQRTVLAPVAADALELPLASRSAAGAIVAFGIRNLADLDAGLREVHRVLEPGARFVILEFSTPRARIVRSVYHAYFHHVLPAVGSLVSGHGSAYRYLPQSVSTFPREAELAARMRASGFADVRWESLTLGVAAIHVGVRDGGAGHP